MSKIFVKFIIWDGISHDGKKIKQRFNGSIKELKKSCQQCGSIILKYKYLWNINKPNRQKYYGQLIIQTLSQTLSNQLTITKSLELLYQEHKTQAIGPIFEDILNSIKSGKSFSQALFEYNNYFSNTQLSLIKAAEKSQQLPDVFEQLAQHIQLQNNIKQQLKKASIYPACVLGFTLLMTAGLLLFAVPQFQSIFKSFNASLPLSTQLLIDTSIFLKNNFIALFLGTIICITALIFTYKKSLKFKYKIQTTLLKIIWIGPLKRSKLIASWCQIMCICLNNHMPITTSIHLSNNIFKKTPFAEFSEKILTRLKQGESLAILIESLNLFSQHDLTVINMGINSNSLAETFQQLTTKHSSNINLSLDRLSKWIEPVIMLLLAIITGGLIISLYLPIFKIGSVL